MLPSGRKFVDEYSEVLLESLGFNDYEDWEPMITKMEEILGDLTLRGVILPEAKPRPGKTIVTLLLNSWLSERGKYWGNLAIIKENTVITPYNDYTKYIIHILGELELVETLDPILVYRDYDIIKNIFKSDDYQKLLGLEGLNITI